MEAGGFRNHAEWDRLYLAEIPGVDDTRLHVFQNIARTRLGGRLQSPYSMHDAETVEPDRFFGFSLRRDGIQQYQSLIGDSNGYVDTSVR